MNCLNLVVNHPGINIILMQLIAGFSLVSLNGCTSPPNTISPTPTAQSPSTASQKQSPATPPIPTPTVRSPSPIAPLTVEKLKNAEYYFLAKGPIKLNKGTYVDPETKRTFTLEDIVSYGDLNKDGIKDAVGSLKVTVPNSGNFSYLVTLTNQNGTAKNLSAEFLGAQVKVKSITIKPDAAIEVSLQQYRPGDADCCPSIELSRTYKLRSNQPASPQASPQK
jgi:hypothetical protein